MNRTHETADTENALFVTLWAIAALAQYADGRACLRSGTVKAQSRDEATEKALEKIRQGEPGAAHYIVHVTMIGEVLT